MEDLRASASLSISRSDDYIVVGRQKSVVAHVEARLKESVKASHEVDLSESGRVWSLTLHRVPPERASTRYELELSSAEGAILTKIQIEAQLQRQLTSTKLERKRLDLMVDLLEDPECESSSFHPQSLDAENADMM